MPGPGRGRTAPQIRSQCRAGAAISVASAAALVSHLVRAGVSPKAANRVVQTGRTNGEIAADIVDLCKTFKKAAR